MILSDQVLARRLLVGAGFRPGPGALTSSKLAINFEGIQFAPHSKEPPQPVEYVGLPASAVANGLVTYTTQKTDALFLQGMAGVFSKPLKFHWIYDETPLYVQVKGMAELDFLKWVAKAMGARLNWLGKEYDFQLDTTAVRLRAAATLSGYAKATTSSDDRRAFEFRIACLNALTPGQFAELVETPTSTLRLPLRPGSSLATLAVARIRDMEKLQKTYGPNSRASKAAIGLLDRVDTDRSAYLMMDAKFYTRLEVPVLDSNGQPAGVVYI